jgi:hypothetical protein
VPEGEERRKLTALLAERKFVPVYLDPAMVTNAFDLPCRSCLVLPLAGNPGLAHAIPSFQKVNLSMWGA